MLDKRLKSSYPVYGMLFIWDRDDGSGEDMHQITNNHEKRKLEETTRVLITWHLSLCFSFCFCHKVRMVLNERLKERARGADKSKVVDFCMGVELIDDKTSILGYQSNRKGLFFKVYVAMPGLVPTGN